MSEELNPYRTPTASTTGRPKFSGEQLWSGFLWGVLGFGGGTGVTAPLILSVEPRDRVLGGMLMGGIPLAVSGLVYGLRRAARQ